MGNMDVAGGSGGELIETTIRPVDELGRISKTRLRRCACLATATGTAQAELTVTRHGETDYRVRYRQNTGAGWSGAMERSLPSEAAALTFSGRVWPTLIAWITTVEPVTPTMRSERDGCSCHA